jgi:uncharacterized membrane protein YqaE (UPF0057 family)
MDLVRILVAILLPPLGVFLQVGIGGSILVEHPLDTFGVYPRHRACRLDYCQALKPVSTLFMSKG